MTFVLITLLLALPFVYKAAAFLVRRRLIATLTALDDLPLLARPRDNGRKIPGTAVICGGSIAGLLSARVCSDHFENVVIVDPEAWIATEEGLHDRHRQTSSAEPRFQKRSRVPQYTALHGYQPFTTITLKKLFPDFEREVKREGARLLPWDLAAHVSGIPIPAPHYQYPNGTLPDSMFLTRPGYESVLRRLVLHTCHNVKYITGSASALLPSSTGAIAAVRVRSPSGVETEMSATLVVDCTGPANGGLRWLANFPLDSGTTPSTKKPTLSIQNLKTTYDHKMSYTTCEFDVPPNLFNKLNTIIPCDYETGGNFYLHLANPKKDRSALAIVRREKNFLQMACGGWDLRERMARISDISGLKSFVSTIVTDRPIADWIMIMLDLFEENNVPTTYVYNRISPAVYVQYSRADRLPANFVALGDSVLQLNPVRGQGCTKACVEAVTLNALLARSALNLSQAGDEVALPDDFSRRFFAAQAKRTGHLWDSLKADDYAWKSTIPAPGDDLESTGAWRRAYESQVFQLAMKDREVGAVLWHVGNWLAPPTDVFSPEILVKIAWMRLRASIGL